LPVYRLTDEIVFPHAALADENGLLAVGGDLRSERLILAYSSGIFPWPHEGCPLLWFSPDPRMVLLPGKLKIGRRLLRTMKNTAFRLTFDTAFGEVIEGCASILRKHEAGTWITPEMIEAYNTLHDLGVAHSVECWLDDHLAGGLYGVSLGAAFIGESMFARASDASKAAFVTLVRQLDRWGFKMIDAQIHTEHLQRFGALEWPRSRYLATLGEAMKQPTRYGPWQIDEDLSSARGLTPEDLKTDLSGSDPDK